MPLCVLNLEDLRQEMPLSTVTLHTRWFFVLCFNPCEDRGVAAAEGFAWGHLSNLTAKRCSREFSEVLARDSSLYRGVQGQQPACWLPFVRYRLQP